MTRDEHRAKCIEALARTYYYEQVQDDDEQFEEATTQEIQACIEVGENLLDCLHGITRVAPVEATMEMTRSWFGNQNNTDYAEAVWRTMAAAGDLTNPPGKKP